MKVDRLSLVADSLVRRGIIQTHRVEVSDKDDGGDRLKDPG